MKLNDRLKTIYEVVKKGETVADVGTDHGFIPIKLIESGKSPYVILADISEESLDKGKENILKAVSDDDAFKIDFRCGDGLKVIDYGEVDDVIIAGMGGRLIRDIMAYDITKTRSLRKFILQPRNHSGELRYWLYKNGFTVVKDMLVRENKYICEIIVAEEGLPQFDVSMFKEDSAELEVPLTLAENDKAILLEFLIRKINKTSEVLKNLKSSSFDNTIKVKYYEQRLSYFSEFLERMK